MHFFYSQDDSERYEDEDYKAKMRVELESYGKRVQYQIQVAERKQWKMLKGLEEGPCVFDALSANSCEWDAYVDITKSEDNDMDGVLQMCDSFNTDVDVQREEVSDRPRSNLNKFNLNGDVDSDVLKSCSDKNVFKSYLVLTFCV